MRMIHLFSLLFLLLKITKIRNNSEKKNEITIYDFINFSNLKCNKTNYITSFNGQVCGNKTIISTQNFAFTITDTKNKKHSIKCSIIIDNSRKLEETDFTEDNYDDYDSDIQQTDTDVQTNTNTENINQKEKDSKYDFISDENSDIANLISNEIISDEPNENQTDYTSSQSQSQSDTSIEEGDSNNIESTIMQDNSDLIIPDSSLINHIDNTNMKEETVLTIIKDSSDSDTFKETTIELEKIDSTSLIKEEDSSLTYLNILSDEMNTSSINNNTETSFSDLNTETSKTNYYIPTTNYNYCYKAICTFKKMIKEDFQIKIDQNLLVTIDEIPEDDNIQLQSIFYEPISYNINNCYIIKNIFKEVLKFKPNISEKKITFLFISTILGKIEEKEEIEANIVLKKKDGNTEQKDAICHSQSEVEPVEGKEILAFYNCEVNNIEKPNEYSGLKFNSSLDVKNIPNDSNLNDPALTDKLIKEGKMQDYSLPIFNSISIDVNDCEKNGIFKISGKLDRKIDEISNFTILLNLNENKNTSTNCSIPKAMEGEVYITCTVHNNFYKSKINIPRSIINDSNNEYILNITEINYEKETTCEIKVIIINTDIINTIPTTSIETSISIPTSIETDIPKILFDSLIIFRQISHLKINSSINEIKFNIIGFTFNTLKKNNYIILPVNLIMKNGNKILDNSTCILNNDDVKGNANNISPFVLECKLDNINNITNVNDTEIISSPLIRNIPIEISNLTLQKASIVDSYINNSKILDYFKEENLNKIPPSLYNLTIDSKSCNIDGVFEIQSYIYNSFDKNITFYLKSNDGSISSRCKIPKENAYIYIICKTMNNFTNNRIKINGKIIYDINYNELFYINDTESLNYFSCENNDKLQFQEAKKIINANNIFRQASHFEKNNNKYHFLLSTFITKDVENKSKLFVKIKIKGELNKKSKNKYNNKRKLYSEEVQNAECTLKMKTEINENGVGSALWDCITGESSINKATGIDILQSDDISGIPNDPALIDPAKTDELIKKGEMNDYSIEENLNELLPIFNTLASNYSLCKQNGSVIFTGNVSSTIKKDIVFNLSISYPESIFGCKLPRTLEGGITEIECFNRDYFENSSSIIIEETVIRDGYNEFFILRNASSGELIITCSSSENKLSEMNYTYDIKTAKKIYKEESQGRIGSIGIIVIIIVGALAFIAIIILFICLNKNNKEKDKEKTENKIIPNSSGNSFGSSSPSYY